MAVLRQIALTGKEGKGMEHRADSGRKGALEILVISMVRKKRGKSLITASICSCANRREGGKKKKSPNLQPSPGFKGEGRKPLRPPSRPPKRGGRKKERKLGFSAIHRSRRVCTTRQNHREKKGIRPFIEPVLGQGREGIHHP